MSGSPSGPRHPAPPATRGTVVRFDGRGWRGIEERAYRDDDGSFRGVTRRLLAALADASFDVRHFEVAPGGHTSLERHAHVHVVICDRGRGSVRLGDEVHALAAGDVVTVGPDEPHQFRCEGDEAFGFVCIVDRVRDRPIPVQE